MTCTLCGSDHHMDKDCRIARKVDLLRQGVSSDAMGFASVEVDDLPKFIEDRRSKR